MTPDEPLRKEAANWLRQAAKDRNAAQVLVGPEPSRSVSHSQQAAEKAGCSASLRGRDRWRVQGRPRHRYRRGSGQG
jgi:hypothetical protein